MSTSNNVLRKQPSVHVSPPEGELPKQKGWISRTLRRPDSARLREDSLGSEQRAERASLQEPRTPGASASRTSLATSNYSGEFDPVDAPAVPPLPNGLSFNGPGLAPLAPPPKIPVRNPTRSLKESTTSSAFLSVSPAHGPLNASATLPLTSLYLVSGLPKSAQTWTLADQDSTAGVHHSEGAVGRFWRAEVLGSSVTPGVGKKKRRGKGVGDDHSSKRLGTLSKNDLGKMLSKALKLSFTREVEIIASTLQPASTVHTFTFQLPSGPDGPTTNSNGLLRTSILSTSTAGDRTTTIAGSNYPYMDPAFPRPSSTYLGPAAGATFDPTTVTADMQPGVPFHGVCLTVWSHADEERTAAIRRTLEVAARHRLSNAGAGPGGRGAKYSTASSKRSVGKKGANASAGPWSATDVEDTDADLDAMSDADPGLGLGGNTEGAGASTLFLPPNTVFWLPYALTLVSRHPIYDLMRDYLTLSWARFSKDVQSHTMQISKILEYPAPRAGEMIKLDAGVGTESMEVVCRFPGGLDFGRGLVDVNFTMWPLFQCLNIDNILTICELALAPTGRVLFLSRHPVMLGIAVATIKYLVELRGWNGISLPIVHARDAKIYMEDPGPWIMGLPTEARYITRIQPEVCICDLDINFVNCSTPPPNVVSVKGQRDKFRKILMSAFDQYYHPDHSIPSEFKEAFPAGRFRPLCKILTKKGSTSTAVAETIRAPDWWHQTKVVQAFDAVLRDKYKKPPLIKRLAMMGGYKRPASLTPAELMVQTSIRKRASAFVDARDDLETKIGRLSRRLNFLLTESELWRQKFVSFEEYAETLSAEAAELRAKIGKEQRESKRLSGLVQLTAHEKDELKHKLINTEVAHREAMIELDRMREEMDEMERERSQMIAEVEAQIERALVSMAFSDNTSEAILSEGAGASLSRPNSALSSRASSRNGGNQGHHLRSFATGTTLAENTDLVDSHPGGDEVGARLSPTTMVTVKEVDEENTLDASHPTSSSAEPLSEKALRRFSATRRESHTDSLRGVDYGIAERTDAVAQKMLQIQQKLEQARLETWQRRADSVASHARSEDGSVRSRSRPHSSRAMAIEAQLTARRQEDKGITHAYGKTAANGHNHAHVHPPPSPTKVASTPGNTSTTTLTSRLTRNGHVSPTLSHRSGPRAPTPKSKHSPTAPAMPAPFPTPAPTVNVSKISGAGMSGTDDSDDYQSAVDVSNPSSDAEGDREQDAADPDTPQLTSFLPSTSRASSMRSRPSTADHTPRESMEYHPYRMAGAFPKTTAAKKQASSSTLHG